MTRMPMHLSLSLSDKKEITVKSFWSSEKAGQFGHDRVL